MSGKIGIFRGKSFQTSFFQEIPMKILRKLIFLEKMDKKSAPDEYMKKSPNIQPNPFYVNNKSTTFTMEKEGRMYINVG
jgi:hypothetical protein